MKKLEGWGLTIAGALLVLVLIAGGIWVRVAAPCSWLDWGSVTDVPARCLMHK